MNYVKNDNKDEIFFCFVACIESAHIQVRTLLPLALVVQGPHPQSYEGFYQYDLVCSKLLDVLVKRTLPTFYLANFNAKYVFT